MYVKGPRSPSIFTMNATVCLPSNAQEFVSKLYDNDDITDMRE